MGYMGGEGSLQMPRTRATGSRAGPSAASPAMSTSSARWEPLSAAPGTTSGMEDGRPGPGSWGLPPAFLVKWDSPELWLRGAVQEALPPPLRRGSQGCLGLHGWNKTGRTASGGQRVRAPPGLCADGSEHGPKAGES